MEARNRYHGNKDNKINKNKASPLYRDTDICFRTCVWCNITLPWPYMFVVFCVCARDGRAHRLWPFCPRTWQWVRSGNDWDGHAIWSELISYSSNHSWPLLAFGWRNYHSGHNHFNPEGNLNHSICGIISCCFCALSCEGIQEWRASPSTQVFSCFFASYSTCSCLYLYRR